MRWRGSTRRAGFSAPPTAAWRRLPRRRSASRRRYRGCSRARPSCAARGSRRGGRRPRPRQQRRQSRRSKRRKRKWWRAWWSWRGNAASSASGSLNCCSWRGCSARAPAEPWSRPRSQSWRRRASSEGCASLFRPRHRHRHRPAPAATRPPPARLPASWRSSGAARRSLHRRRPPKRRPVRGGRCPAGCSTEADDLQALPRGGRLHSLAESTAPQPDSRQY
mmetsp:Transcript_27271/g.70096  ORF Transcript_27271/g.70096 Transcript_27271/m.70096 type:complete len:221 (-) Transcript_27271:280-942(-)